MDKVIYIDCDCLVLGSIKELWDTDISNFPLAAVDDYGEYSFSNYLHSQKKILGIPNEQRYFNAGLLVMNLKILRNIEFTYNAIEYARNNAHKLKYPDQDTLNIILGSRRLSINHAWNTQTPYFCGFNHRKWKKLTGNEIFHEAKIIHYTAEEKPWIWKSSSPYKKEYLAISTNLPQDNKQIHKWKCSRIYKPVLFSIKTTIKYLLEKLFFH